MENVDRLVMLTVCSSCFIIVPQMQTKCCLENYEDVLERGNTETQEARFLCDNAVLYTMFVSSSENKCIIVRIKAPSREKSL